MYPTALRLATLQITGLLAHEHKRLANALEVKAAEFDGIQKLGRTQLQDAVQMTVGPEFLSFANTIREDIERLEEVERLLLEVNLGGTGVNTPKDYSHVVVQELARISGFALRQSKDLVEAPSDLGAFVTFSGILKRIAVKLSKICNDLRLPSSGPRAGLGEIRLPYSTYFNQFEFYRMLWRV